MALQPPPHTIDQFIYIWKRWLYDLWDHVNLHTGGSTPTLPATGTSWNAHGNTATGAAASPLVIDAGSFVATGTVGDVPDEIKVAGSHFAWIPSVASLRAGQVTDTRWATIASSSIAIGKDTDAGASSTAIGFEAEATASTSIALGGNAKATQVSTMAVGPGAQSNAFGGISIGNGTLIDTLGFGGIAIGADVSATAASSIVIGKGVGGGGSQFVNSTGSSMMLGVGLNSSAGDVATITLRNKRCGVNNITPISTLDVGGNVGYKYTVLTGSKTIGASDEELCFFVDTTGSTLAAPYVITLPAITSAAVDRRMYHIKNAYGGSGTHPLTITPNGTDLIDQSATSGPGNAPANTSISLNKGDSIQIVAANNGWGGSPTWWII